MMLKLLIVVLLLFGYVSIAGGTDVIVTECSDAAVLHVGDCLTIQLGSQVTSGYLWQLFSQSSGILHLLGPAETVWPRDRSDVDGGSEHQLFRFKADKAGTDLLLFHRAHPWSPNNPPLETCTIRVTVSS